MPEEPQGAALSETSSTPVEGQTQSTSGSGQVTAKSEGGGGKPASQNWHDDPEYRKMQSEKDRMVAEARRKAEALQAERDRIASQLKNLSDKKLSEQERKDLEMENLRSKLAAVEQEREIERITREIEEHVTLMREFLPEDEIKQQPDLISAYRHALQAAQQKLDKMAKDKAHEITRKQEANAPDLGSGSPSSTDDASEGVRILKEKGVGAFYEHILGTSLD